MINYKDFTTINEINGSESRHINVINEDGSIKGFPVDNSNSSYISFLRQLSEQNPNDPHYQEWLSQGNTPEDFWTHDLDSPEGLEQPKEEETPQEGEG